MNKFFKLSALSIAFAGLSALAQEGNNTQPSPPETPTVAPTPPDATAPKKSAGKVKYSKEETKAAKDNCKDKKGKEKRACVKSYLADHHQS